MQDTQKREEEKARYFERLKKRLFSKGAAFGMTVAFFAGIYTNLHPGMGTIAACSIMFYEIIREWLWDELNEGFLSNLFSKHGKKYAGYTIHHEDESREDAV